jgi:branched-chain amino acid transport system ATP-binding protein
MTAAESSASASASASVGAGREVLSAAGLTAGYNDERIIHDIDVSFHAAQLTALIGSNGAGKSTLLKSLFALTRIFAGQLRIDGTVTKPDARVLVARGMSYVPQVANVFPTMTVLENLEVGTYVRKGGSVELVVDVFPVLGKLMKRPAHKLSGGERNMLAVGRALMSQPVLLLLDEPTGGLAPGLAEDFWHYLTDLAGRGIAIAAVEQNVDMAIQFARDVYVLADGRIALHGSGAELARLGNLDDLFLGRPETIEQALNDMKG